MSNSNPPSLSISILREGEQFTSNFGGGGRNGAKKDASSEQDRMVFTCLWRHMHRQILSCCKLAYSTHIQRTISIFIIWIFFSGTECITQFPVWGNLHSGMLQLHGSIMFIRLSLQNAERTITGTKQEHVKRRKDLRWSERLAQIFNVLNCFIITFSYFLASHRQPVCCSGEETVSPTAVRILKNKVMAQVVFACCKSWEKNALWG